MNSVRIAIVVLELEIQRHSRHYVKYSHYISGDMVDDVIHQISELFTSCILCPTKKVSRWRSGKSLSMMDDLEKRRPDGTPLASLALLI